MTIAGRAFVTFKDHYFIVVFKVGQGIFIEFKSLYILFKFFDRNVYLSKISFEIAYMSSNKVI